METLETRIQNDYLLIQLKRGRSNPINAQMVNELRQVFRDLPHDTDVKGAILTGQPKFFSVGLDVVELYDYDRETMKAFWFDFSHLIVEMISCPKPIVAAINGHSPAGGCVLAMCCDYRVMANGKYNIGLNEIPVGIVAPSSIYYLYSFVVGEGLAYQLLMDGTLMNAEAAHKIRLVNEVADEADVLTQAENKLQQYMGFSPTAWQESKRNLRKPLLKRINDDFESGFEGTLYHWWSPEFRSQLQAMIAKLKG